MISDITSKRKNLSYRILSCFIAVTFISNVVLPPGYAQLVSQAVLNLPAPGTMVSLSAGFAPALVKGLTIDPGNPLQFEFFISKGDGKLGEEAFKEESKKLIKYFLASLTVPEEELWVNLSPYEKDRIIPQGFGETEMGRDMLAQDYILKQLTASLMYPEKELGKRFWDKVYKKARALHGTAEIPMDTFNKVWIVPDKAVVYEHGNSVFVVDSHLKVMLEADYMAREASLVKSEAQNESRYASRDTRYESEIIREVIIPALEKEVNEGESFAALRQIYHSSILAVWYKQNLRKSLLGQVYADQNKIKGIDLEDKTVKQKIYDQYLEAFKKGVYNYIKEDYDPATRSTIPRKYFSGGTNLTSSSIQVRLNRESLDSYSPEWQRLILDAVRDGDFQVVLWAAVENSTPGEIALATRKPEPAAVSVSPGTVGGLSEQVNDFVEKLRAATNVPISRDMVEKALRYSLKNGLNKNEFKDFTVVEVFRAQVRDGNLAAALASLAARDFWTVVDRGNFATSLQNAINDINRKNGATDRDVYGKVVTAIGESGLGGVGGTAASVNGARSASSSPVDFDFWAQKLNLGPADLIHMAGLIRKYEKGSVPLVIGHNFRSSALLTEDERKALLGAEDYKTINGDKSNAQAARNVVLTLNPMDGGLGSTVKREKYLKQTIGLERGIGAKATDLFLGVKLSEGSGSLPVSIAEIKLLRAITDAAQFGQVYFQPLVNKDSAPSYEKLLNSSYLPDRGRGVVPGRTYRQILETNGVRLFPGQDEMLYQMDLPIVDLETKQLTDKYTAPGGHGQWGVRLLYDALNVVLPEDGKTRIRAFYNGDGVANFPDASIVGWMAKEKAGIVMVSTTKAGLDKKGGQLGVQILADGKEVPQILELAQAKKSKQEKLFYEIGLPGKEFSRVPEVDENNKERGESFYNEPNAQYFNTNIALINYTVLTPLLKDFAMLTDVAFNGESLSGKELIQRIISPDLIENEKEKDDGRVYTQLEGAIASTLLNLNAFFETTKDRRVKALLKKHGGEKLLRIVNVDGANRTKLFTPVKNAFDFWFQAYSDYYMLDTASWTLKENRPEDGRHLIPPAVEFSGYKKDKDGKVVMEKGKPKSEDFYEDVQNNIDAFGRASTRELESLSIKGKVSLKDAVLRGKVVINNDYHDIVDLNDPQVRRVLGQEGTQPLVLENIHIKISQDGSVSYEGISSVSSPVTLNDQVEALVRILNDRGLPVDFEGSVRALKSSIIKGSDFAPLKRVDAGDFLNTINIKSTSFWGSVDMDELASSLASSFSAFGLDQQTILEAVNQVRQDAAMTQPVSSPVGLEESEPLDGAMRQKYMTFLQGFQRVSYQIDEESPVLTIRDAVELINSLFEMRNVGNILASAVKKGATEMARLSSQLTSAKEQLLYSKSHISNVVAEANIDDLEKILDPLLPVSSPVTLGGQATRFITTLNAEGLPMSWEILKQALSLSINGRIGDEKSGKKADTFRGFLQSNKVDEALGSIPASDLWKIVNQRDFIDRISNELGGAGYGMIQGAIEESGLGWAGGTISSSPVQASGGSEQTLVKRFINDFLSELYSNGFRGTLKNMKDPLSKSVREIGALNKELFQKAQTFRELLRSGNVFGALGSLSVSEFNEIVDAEAFLGSIQKLTFMGREGIRDAFKEAGLGQGAEEIISSSPVQASRKVDAFIAALAEKGLDVNIFMIREALSRSIKENAPQKFRDDVREDNVMRAIASVSYWDLREIVDWDQFVTSMRVRLTVNGAKESPETIEGVIQSALEQSGFKVPLFEQAARFIQILTDENRLPMDWGIFRRSLLRSTISGIAGELGSRVERFKRFLEGKPEDLEKGTIENALGLFSIGELPKILDLEQFSQKISDELGNPAGSPGMVRGALEESGLFPAEGATVSSPVGQAKDKEVGGINLDPALLDLQIRRDANFVPLPLPQQPIRQMHIEGFIPVIINITPVTNLPMLLGLADTKQDTEETTPAMKAREPEEISVLN